MFQLWSHFCCQLVLASLKLQESLRFFVSSCPSPGQAYHSMVQLFLLQLHFVVLHFPLFLHHSLFAVILQLLCNHTFISNRLSWIAFCFHSYWLSLIGCVRLSFRPSHLDTYGERIKKKNKKQTNKNPQTRINNLKSVLSTNIQNYLQRTAFYFSSFQPDSKATSGLGDRHSWFSCHQ